MIKSFMESQQEDIREFVELQERANIDGSKGAPARKRQKEIAAQICKAENFSTLKYSEVSKVAGDLFRQNYTPDMEQKFGEIDTPNSRGRWASIMFDRYIDDARSAERKVKERAAIDARKAARGGDLQAATAAAPKLSDEEIQKMISSLYHIVYNRRSASDAEVRNTARNIALAILAAGFQGYEERLETLLAGIKQSPESTITSEDFQNRISYLRSRIIDARDKLQEKDAKKKIMASGRDKLSFFEHLFEVHREDIRKKLTDRFTADRRAYLAAVPVYDGNRYPSPFDHTGAIIPGVKLSPRTLYIIGLTSLSVESLIATSIDEAQKKSHIIRKTPGDVFRNHVFTIAQNFGVLEDNVYRNDSEFDRFLADTIAATIEWNERKLKEGISNYLGGLDIVSVDELYVRFGVKGIEGEFKLNLADGGAKFMTTQSVGVGGYNIVKFHYRYIINVK